MQDVCMLLSSQQKRCITEDMRTSTEINKTDAIVKVTVLLELVIRHLKTCIISNVITRLIVINIAPLTVLFCNCPLKKY